MLPPASIEAIGFMAAACTTFCWFPQAVRTIRTRDTNGISLWMQGFLVIGILLWLAYGILLMSWPLIISNIITIIPVAIILVMKLRHG